MVQVVNGIETVIINKWDSWQGSTYSSDEIPGRGHCIAVTETLKVTLSSENTIDLNTEEIRQNIHVNLDI